MLKFGFCTRAEFFRHTAFLFLHQTGLINARTLGLSLERPETDGDADAEELSDFEMHQRELADFILKYNRKNGTNFPLPPTYSE